MRKRKTYQSSALSLLWEKKEAIKKQVEEKVYYITENPDKKSLFLLQEDQHELTRLKAQEDILTEAIADIRHAVDTRKIGSKNVM